MLGGHVPGDAASCELLCRVSRAAERERYRWRDGLVPVVNGAESGHGIHAYLPVTAYTLRVRLHCVEMQRVMQRYYCMVDGVIEGLAIQRCGRSDGCGV
jgi:hypothetical protein